MIMQSGQPVSVTNGAAYPRGDYNADGTTETDRITPRSR